MDNEIFVVNVYKLCGVLRWLVIKILKMGVSLSDPPRPKARLQILPTTLRNKILITIPSYSKASGVFSSYCQ